MDDDDLRILIGATAGEKAPPELLDFVRAAASGGPGCARAMLEPFWEQLWHEARKTGGLQAMMVMTRALVRLQAELK